MAFSERYASVGAHAEAVALLRETALVVPGQEARFRLAGMQALDGDLAASAWLLRELTHEPATNRGAYDAPQLLVRVGAERRADQDVAVAIETLVAPVRGDSPGLAATLRARANVILDRVGDGDASVRAWPWAPDGDAIAVLARWRLGRSTDGDVKAMERLSATMTDADADIRLALAAALLATGRSDACLSACYQASAKLEPAARLSFESRQHLQLSRALEAKALLAAGRPAEARARAAELLETATPGLLWSNLAKEVVAATGPGYGPSRRAARFSMK
jgi:hypothetical protein